MSKDPPCSLQPLDVVVNESLKAARIQEDSTLVFIDVGDQDYVMGVDWRGRKEPRNIWVTVQPGISVKTFPEVQHVSIPLSYMSLDASFLCKLA